MDCPSKSSTSSGFRPCAPDRKYEPALTGGAFLWLRLAVLAALTFNPRAMLALNRNADKMTQRPIPPDGADDPTKNCPALNRRGFFMPAACVRWRAMRENTRAEIALCGLPTLPGLLPWSPI